MSSVCEEPVFLLNRLLSDLQLRQPFPNCYGFQANGDCFGEQAEDVLGAALTQQLIVVTFGSVLAL